MTGFANLAMASEIDLERALDDFRLQNLIFRAARKLFLQNAESFGGDKQFLAVQLIRIVEQFLSSDKLYIPSVWHQDAMRKQILFALNIGYRGRACEPVCPVAQYREARSRVR